MPLLDFAYTTNDQLSIVENAINHAVSITNNLLYITDLNSPYRILVEAQCYIYNSFLQKLSDVDREITLMFLEIMGIVPKVSRASRVTLTFRLINYSPDTVYFNRGFPVRASNGLIFVTESLLSIPSGSMSGSVSAVCLTEGTDGNVPSGSITQALQVIAFPFTVTNESSAKEGANGETLLDAQMRLSALIRRSGLVTARDYIAYCREIIPDLVVSVGSPIPNTIEVYACKNDGELLTTIELQSLRTQLLENSFIGLDALTVNNIDVIDVYVEVVGSIRRLSDTLSVAEEIKSIMFEYLMPDNDRQIDENTSGIILINEIERQVNQSFIDFIQSVRIGTSKSAAFGQNFVFNPMTQRVRLDTLEVTLIRDQAINTYTYSRNL